MIIQAGRVPNVPVAEAEAARDSDGPGTVGPLP
jgi:hypothetical protein